MNLLGLIMPFVNILFSLMEVLYGVLLFFDAVIYDLIAYTFKVFLLMSTVNFNSLYGIVSPIVDRFQAVVIVFIVYQIGISFINYMLKPDDFVQDGTKLLRNIFIATALFVSYNFIFSLFNELNIIMLGNPSGYKYHTLSQVFDLNEEESVGQNEHGILTTFVFGESGLEGKDPGQSMALSLASIFIKDTSSDSGSIMIGTVKAADYNFRKALPSLSDEINNGLIDYTYLIGFFVGLFVIYSIFNMSLQIGIRMFKLLILQMVTPIVILDVIKNGLEGKFKEFCKKYLSVFIEAFTRVLTLLITTVFVSKFLAHVDTYFPSLQTNEGWFTKGLIMVLITISAYMFAGQVPKFLDEILGTSMASGDTKNFLGGLLGAGVGAIAGFAGGLAGGGLGSAVAGLGSGLVSGAVGGSKGSTIADMFKTGKDVRGNALTKGQSIRAEGGWGHHLKGNFERALGITSLQNKQLADLQVQSDALESYSDSQSNAIRELKTGAHLYDSDGKQLATLADSAYVAGYTNEKYGDDKGDYARRMLQYDREYLGAETDLETIKAAATNGQETYKYNDKDISIDEALRLANQHVASTRSAAIKRAEDNYDGVKSHSEELDSAAMKESMVTAGILNADGTVKNKVKHDNQQLLSQNVTAKRSNYLKRGGKLGDGNTYKTEKQRIFAQQQAILNKTHSASNSK